MLSQTAKARESLTLRHVTAHLTPVRAMLSRKFPLPLAQPLATIPHLLPF
jgi:hypothetical protein